MKELQSIETFKYPNVKERDKTKYKILYNYITDL